MLLAIDTSTAVAGVALYRDGVRAEHTWHSGRSHTTQLMANVERLLAEDGARPSDLKAVGVALGPGSFNGLRVGLATAKLLSFSLGVPLVGVDTLTATAYQYREWVPSGSGKDTIGRWLIRPLYDAGRGQLATALYSPTPDGIREVEPPRLAVLQDLLGRAIQPTLYCGEIADEWGQEIGRLGGPLAMVVVGAGALRRPGFLAELAWGRFQAGSVADVTTLQPLYLRRPPVLEKQDALEMARPSGDQVLGR